MKNLWISLKITLAMCIVLGVGYVLVLRGVSAVAGPNGGEADVVTLDGQVVGAANVGQRFTDVRYFWSRPSAVDYNGGGSGGSNKATTNPEHLAGLKEKGIKAFDLICVNLYDFESALAKGLKPREAIEEIDIGGPCMLRAASKNFHSILVLSDPDTYAEATAELKANDMSVSLPFRQRMAARTFAKTSRYDAMIAEYLTKN